MTTLINMGGTCIDTLAPSHPIVYLNARVAADMLYTGQKPAHVSDPGLELYKRIGMSLS